MGFIKTDCLSLIVVDTDCDPRIEERGRKDSATRQRGIYIAVRIVRGMIS